MATKKVIDMSTRAAGANYDDYVYLTAASPDTDERWPTAYLRQFILDGITGGYGIDAVPAGNPAAANTTVDLVLDVSELTAAAGTADVTDYVVIEAASDNSTKKILVGSLPFVSTGVAVTSVTGGTNLTTPSTTGAVTVNMDSTLTGLTSVTSTAFAGALTGNASTATALETARTIGGTSFDGTAAIVPATITVADTTDTTAYVGLWEDATGDLAPKTDTGITYNAGTGMLSATGFTGPLTGTASLATALVSTLGVAGGGTGMTSIAKGGVIVSSAADTFSALLGGVGEDGYVLTYNETADTLTWEPHAGSAGTVSSVAISGTDGIDVDSGSPITTSGTITLGLSGIANSALTNSSVSYGGVSLSLGGSDATPAFDLADATNYEGSAILSTGETGTTKFLRVDGDNSSSWQVPPDTNTTYTAGDGLDLTGTTFSTDLMANGGLEITSTELSVAVGISQYDVAQFTTGVVDDDFLRIDGTTVEGRSASEVLSDIGAQAALSFGISSGDVTKCGSGIVDDDFIRIDGTTTEGRSASEVLTDIGASPVAGSSSIVTVGTLSSGTIEGTSVLSTTETGGTKFLREDGDNSCSWQPVPAAGISAGFSIAMAVAL